MKHSPLFFFALLLYTAFIPFQVQAFKPIGKYFSSKEEANAFVTKHYNLGCDYYNNQEWRNASKEFEKVIRFLPCSDVSSDAAYYLAVSYFKMKEYDFANAEF